MIKRKKKNKEQNPFYDPTLKSRHASSGRFKKFTLISLIFSILFLVVFLVDIFSKGVPALSKALGETMVVVMAAGLRPNLSWNPLEDMTTVTVTIVNALVGDFEFSSPETLSAFALGLVLFVVTLILNMISLSLIRINVTTSIWN